MKTPEEISLELTKISQKIFFDLAEWNPVYALGLAELIKQEIYKMPNIIKNCRKKE